MKALSFTKALHSIPDRYRAPRSYGSDLHVEIGLEIIVYSVKIVSRAPAGLLLVVTLQHARAVPLQLLGAAKARRAEEAVPVRVPQVY